MTANVRNAWTIVTGEYPPQFGGVADYTYQIAEALAEAGDVVDVFAPGVHVTELPGRARVHRLRYGYSPRGLLEFYRQASALPRPRRILLQYVAQSFGLRAVNLPFVLALRWTAARTPLSVMFHEFAIQDDATQGVFRRCQAFGTRVLADMLARSADRILVSTEAWLPRVRAAAPSANVVVAPIPSNLPLEISEDSFAPLRSRITPNGAQVVGHFGTYRMPESRKILIEIITSLLHSDDKLIFLLVGKGSDEFLRELLQNLPDLDGRLCASGRLTSQETAAYIAVCDVLVQPYAEGVTTRRGSLLAGLALGVPTVATLGTLSESLWAQCDALVLTAPHDVEAITSQTLRLLRNEAARGKLTESSRTFYAKNFALLHTIGKLRGE